MAQHQFVPVVGLDGPSATGKGSTARRVAERLGYHYIDSGKYYRAVAYLLLRHGFDHTNVLLCAEIAEKMDAVFEGQVFYLFGENIQDMLATEEISDLASKIAMYPELRKIIQDKEKKQRRLPGLVIDGRDCAKVFPDAAMYYIDCGLDTRAMRRYNELVDLYPHLTLESVRSDLDQRDLRDKTRAVDPLVYREDTHYYIDNGSLTLDQTVSKVLDHYLKR